jgi:uncharacterized protein (DUF924 family)
MSTAQEIYDFWFRETPSERWFKPDPAFDETVRERFAETWRRGLDGELEEWEATPDGALALTVLLDQFPRNMFRGTKHAFASDDRASEAAKRAIARNFDLAMPEAVRFFFYLPLMHAENLADQDECVRLTKERLGEAHFSMPFALSHREAIRRFGRFPGRNRALSRETTAEEEEFLSKNPAGF